jgi:hypothetical protein
LGKIIPIKVEDAMTAQKLLFDADAVVNDPIRRRMRNESDAFFQMELYFGNINFQHAVNCADLFHVGDFYNKTSKPFLISHLGFTQPRVAVSTINMAFSNPGVVVFIDCMILTREGIEKHGRFMMMVEVKSKDELILSNAWRWSS